MAPKDFVELIKHYYMVSTVVAILVVTSVALSRTVWPHWVALIGLGTLATWAVWAGLYIHRVNQERKRR